jgi:hypothetical protein
MKPAPNRTRQNDPEGLRTRVLDAAADLFEVRGYHATSVKDLMQATGVSGGALPHQEITGARSHCGPGRTRRSADVDRSDSCGAVARQRDCRRIC